MPLRCSLLSGEVKGASVTSWARAGRTPAKAAPITRCARRSRRFILASVMTFPNSPAPPRRLQGTGQGRSRYFISVYPDAKPEIWRHDMDKDRVEGSANQAKGSIKEAAGKVTGDTKLQAEGKADKAAGKVQNAVGGMKDAIRDVSKH